MILAIDTSCDETSVSVVEGRKVMSNVIASQVELQKKYGGVYPTEAKRQHEKVIDAVINEAMLKAKTSWNQIETIAVTAGPGLAPALEVGIAKAKDLANKNRKEIVGINHMEGHLLSCLARNSKNRGLYESNLVEIESVEFPVLGLLVSGGHSEIVLVNDIGCYEIIGKTLDDACGECLDKAARMMGLGYPGGAIIEQFAKKGKKGSIKLPIPMRNSGDMNMSFSGLKTAVLYEIRAQEKGTRKIEKGKDTMVKDLQWGKQNLEQQYIYNLCLAVQTAVIVSLLEKLEMAIKKYQPSWIWLGGGVGVNKALRLKLRKLANKYGIKLGLPYSKKLYGDNAAMIGVAASLGSQKKRKWKNQTVERIPRWSLDQGMV